MTQTQLAIAAAFLLAGMLASASVHASTITPADLIWTDAGFRQADDCAETMRLRDWHNGHYWSARPVMDCTRGDQPYASGKVPVTLAALDDITNTRAGGAAHYPAASVLHPRTPGGKGCLCVPPATHFFGPPAGGHPTVTVIHKPHVPPAPIPLPASAWLLLGAMLLIWAAGVKSPTE